jgi:hypothetical protein
VVQAPRLPEEEITADHNDMIYAAPREEIEAPRKAFIRASDPDDCERGIVGAGARVCRARFADWAAVDPAGEEAMLFYSIRPERLLMEPLEYDLLFRWFVGIGVDRVLEEPRPSAGRRHRGQVPGRGAGAAQGEEAFVERSLLGGGHAD